MSKVTVRLTPTGTWIECESATVVEAFKQIAAYQQVFSEKACGACGSTKIAYQHRTTRDGKDIFEIACQECKCALTFWPHKEGGTLFAKRWDSERKCEVGKNGWVKYERQQQAAPSQPSAPEDDPTPF